MSTNALQIATHEPHDPERNRNRVRSGGGINAISSSFA
jgi:hypothetical protein